MKILTIAIVSSILFSQNTLASFVKWHKQSATVWLSAQTISGEVDDASAHFITIHHDSISFNVTVDKKYFTFTVNLHNDVNKIWAVANNNIDTALADTLHLVLGYKLLPEAHPFATIKGSKVLLHANVAASTWPGTLRYIWKAGPHNPAPLHIHRANDSLSEAFIPYVTGEYTFLLNVISGTDTAAFATIVTRDNNGLRAFDVDADHAAWISRALIYEITPHLFTDSSSYNSISTKLPELKQLGINTIWLQPLYKTSHGGQGYDVTDYFSLRRDFGSEDELKHLITAAKNLNMHVLFDFVPNHTSISHPYAIDCLARDTASPYYGFYQHNDDGSPYSSHLKKNGPFMVYFWKDLVNLDFTNPEVQQWIVEACKFWIRKYDIDGYRFDAMWAVNARAPLFGKRLQRELKSIKPGLLLLAEDKGSVPATYRKGFDVAYDWTADTTWISQWSWQTDYDEKNSLTIFNNAHVDNRSTLLKKALFDNGGEANLKLRFIENNDMSRFIRSHDLKRTRMAGALIFALPGIPMIYNGQEIGSLNHPYTRKPIFKRDSTIKSMDKHYLFSYYRQLTTIWSKYESLRSGGMHEVPCKSTAPVVAFLRRKNNESVVVVINLSEKPASVTLNLNRVPTTRGHLLFKDLLENKNISVENDKSGQVKLMVDGYTTRILLRQ